jgi:uncharacterized membrane protein (UPF0127 family)
MVGMRYPIDVAVLGRDGLVLLAATLRPGWGMTRPRLRATATVECAAGSLRRWGVRKGSRLSIRPAGPPEVSPEPGSPPVG